MTTLIPDIKSRDWQLSLRGVGLVAEGLEDIRQCLDICLRTVKGTDPLRPEFGSDIYQYIDQPVSTAIPNIVKAIIEAVQIWEKRVIITKVRYQQEISKVDFFITYKLVDDELIDLLRLQLSGGFIIVDTLQIGTLTIYALYPPNPNSKRYQIDFSANDASALPTPPASGFATIDEMHIWVVANWSGYGTWQKAADRITGFLKPGIFTATASIGLIGTKKFTAPIPLLAAGQHYNIKFNPDAAGEIQTGSLESVERILGYLNDAWLNYGTWSIESFPGVGGEFDISQFDSGEFEAGSEVAYILVLISEIVNDATLIVDAE